MVNDIENGRNRPGIRRKCNSAKQNYQKFLASSHWGDPWLRCNYIVSFFNAASVILSRRLGGLESIRGISDAKPLWRGFTYFGVSTSDLRGGDAIPFHI